jgi:hypothetical protein
MYYDRESSTWYAVCMICDQAIEKPDGRLGYSHVCVPEWA